MCGVYKAGMDTHGSYGHVCHCLDWMRAYLNARTSLAPRTHARTHRVERERERGRDRTSDKSFIGRVVVLVGMRAITHSFQNQFECLQGPSGREEGGTGGEGGRERREGEGEEIDVYDFRSIL
jgi:hypothetical protein